jgi:hypothetical protein
MVALVTAGCATTAAERAYNKKIAVATSALIAAGDPDSLAAAALLKGWLGKGPPKGLPLAARAAAAAPERRDLTWLHLQLCGLDKACATEPVELHLRSLDPANGVAWLGPLNVRSTSEDPAEIRQRLAAVANSERFDLYWNAIVLHATNAILKTGTMDSPTALTSVLGTVTAVAIPGYESLSRVCKGESLEEPNIRAECRRASQLLRSGDTYLSELIGIAIAKRVWPEGSAEYESALAARRTVRYRMHMDLEVNIRADFNEEFANNYLKLVATHQTEQEVGLAQIVDAGFSPDPPEDWQDPLAH